MRRAGTMHLGGTLDEIAASERAPERGETSDRPFVLLAQPTMFDPSRAPEGRHTAWAYCHVPNGSTVDMTDAIERQIERFAPGFGELVLARNAMGPARPRATEREPGRRRHRRRLERASPAASRALHSARAVLDAARRRLPLLGLHASRRRRPRHVRLPGGARGATSGRLTSRSATQPGRHATLEREAGGAARAESHPSARAEPR